jgi:hypothetical protein
MLFRPILETVASFARKETLAIDCFYIASASHEAELPFADAKCFGRSIRKRQHYF